MTGWAQQSDRAGHKFNRSSFWEFTDRQAAADALVQLTADSPVPFSVLGIFDGDGQAAGVTVYFTLAVGELVDHGDVTNDAGVSVHVGLWYEGELEFHGRARELGGTYTGS